MGGGNGVFTGKRGPAKVTELVRKAEAETSVAAFDAQLSGVLGDLLGAYNSRDAQLTRNRLDDIKERLKDSIEGTVDELYGGSVAKHTYVDGLSDIDTLLLINKTELEGNTPGETLDRVTEILKQRLGTGCTVTHGQLAVTIQYPDGMTVQLLPTIRTDQGLRIPSATQANTWAEIDPSGFQDALRRSNEACDGKLVPTIKLAKAVLGNLPEEQRLSGYHVESLAISAFRGYEGPRKTSAMLPHFFERAKDLVLEPIKDSTGQSVHVDDDLGPPGSAARLQASHILQRIAKRMRNATAGMSEEQWRALFFEPDE